MSGEGSAQTVDRRPGKAPIWLRGAGREAPGSFVGALGQRDGLILPLQGDRRAGYEDEL